jgi:hypothetical protein
MAAEDDIDIETLQAQIDMSMSFAHNLVTSWIKPTQMGQLRSNGTNATQILEEELRRPPRYAVNLCDDRSANDFFTDWVWAHLFLRCRLRLVKPPN